MGSIAHSHPTGPPNFVRGVPLSRIYQYVGRFSFDAAHLRNIDLRRKSRLCPTREAAAERHLYPCHDGFRG